jgi:WD40 repeat protein/serine/threonine protein kinase
MSTSSSERNPVEILAEEFLARKRRGEKPTLGEYLERYPALAEEIRDLFPALFMMENLGEESGCTTGSLARDGDGVAAPGIRLQKLGDYRILREIGRGGMGVVYEAEQESLGRRVALKVLSAGAVADTAAVRRFEREARAAARLHHTNIVPVFGVGQQDGHHYYVMQFIAGLGLDLVLQDLRRLRRTKGDPQLDAVPEPQVRDRHDPSAQTPERNKIGLTAADVARSLITGRDARDDLAPVGASTTEPFDGAGASAPRPMVPAGNRKADSSSVALPGSSELSAVSGSDRRYYQSVAKIGVLVAEALEYANRQGVLLRDIKPSNLLLDNRGNVWVADFGLAKTAEADDLTNTGDIVGTVRYMAPERFQGKCDARSDVYSLGLTLYELVALRPAYQAADRHSLMERVLQEEPPRLRKLAPGLPRDLETIIAKATARDPAGRYATAGALAEDLQRFVEDRPIRARRAGLAERAWRWSRRNKALAGLMASVASLLIVVAVGSALSAVRFRGMNRSLQGMNRTLESNLYFSDIDRAHGEWLAENPGQAEKLLDGCPPRLRGWEWHFLKRQSHTALLTIHAHDDYVFEVVYSPDGKALATSSQDGTARVFDAATGRLIRTLRGHYPDICWRVAYSPDGTMLASAGRDRTVKIWDARTWELIRTLGEHPDTVYGVAFSPDGRLLASGSSVTKLWDTKTWREIRTVANGGSVTFSPDGRRLASSGQRLLIWDTATLKTETDPVPTSTLDTTGWHVAFSPNSRSITVGNTNNDLLILEIESGRTTLSLHGHTNRIMEVAYSPDGRCLASASWDQTVRLWDAASGRLLRTFRGHVDRATGVSFAPDSHRLASSCLDGTVKIWDVTNPEDPASQEARTLARKPGAALGVVHCADGLSFATVSGSLDWKGSTPARVGAVTIWDSKSGQEVRTLTAPDPSGGPCHDVAFDHEFTRIAWASGNGTVEIRDATTNGLVLALPGHAGPVERVAYSPDGRRLASASRDGTVRVWDWVTGQPVRVFSGHSDSAACLRFSPDGLRLALGGWNAKQLHPSEVKVWDVATGQSLPTMGGYFDELMSAAFHPRLGQMACAVGSDIFMLDMASGRELSHLRGHGEQVRSVVFSPDGQRLASGGDGGTVKLWETSSGREVLSLIHGKDDHVTGVSFSPDGRQIVSTSKSGTIKVWDATPLP